MPRSCRRGGTHSGSAPTQRPPRSPRTRRRGGTGGAAATPPPPSRRTDCSAGTRPTPSAPCL
uniref:Uncharacterized protein n=1 Tax=Arundo donax TaxID=35708 RepID=A0A0A8ZSU6_ARUDO